MVNMTAIMNGSEADGLNLQEQIHYLRGSGRTIRKPRGTERSIRFVVHLERQCLFLAFRRQQNQKKKKIGTAPSSLRRFSVNRSAKIEVDVNHPERHRGIAMVLAEYRRRMQLLGGMLAVELWTPEVNESETAAFLEDGGPQLIQRLP